MVFVVIFQLRIAYDSDSVILQILLRQVSSLIHAAAPLNNLQELHILLLVAQMNLKHECLRGVC